MSDELTIDTSTGQLSLLDGQEEQAAFVDKFKPKVTTDDCYTPANVHQAVVDWVAKEYGLDPATFLRPFWPGKDFTAEEYPEGCVVVDNPPFSIRGMIVNWYLAHGVKFFIYSPALTLLTRAKGVCHIATGAGITYENGAVVPTSFVTNLEPDTILRTAPDLYKAIDKANTVNVKAMKKELPKYTYPDYVITAAIAQRWCHHGIDWRLPAEECIRVSTLDSQKPVGKAIFGGGYLLSERAAAERAAAERAAAERAAATKWGLSAREMGIIAMLSKKSGGGRNYQCPGRTAA